MFEALILLAVVGVFLYLTLSDPEPRRGDE